MTHERDVARHERQEAMDHRDSILKELYEAQHKVSGLESDRAEIDRLGTLLKQTKLELNGVLALPLTVCLLSL